MFAEDLFRTVALFDPLFHPYSKIVPTFRHRDDETLVVDLPGVTKADVELSLEPGSRLRLLAKRGEQRYEALWELADYVNTEAITSKLENGELAISLPSRAGRGTRSVKVD
jgi:HSP20 family molecular chaperone IbpA